MLCGIETEGSARSLGSQATERHREAGQRGWTVRLRHCEQPFSNPPDEYLLSYALPFGMPVGKRQNVGTIQGRICDAQRPDQPGLA